MQGPSEDPGINIRALRDLFAATAAEGDALGDGDVHISVAMLEIYNEEIRDLLASTGDAASPGGVKSSGRGLDISAMGAGQLPPGALLPHCLPPDSEYNLRCGPWYVALPCAACPVLVPILVPASCGRRGRRRCEHRRCMHAGADRIPGLTWRRVGDIAEVAAALGDGSRQRATCATAINVASSRSHAVLSVRVCATAGRASLLHLIDLAGGSAVAHCSSSGQPTVRSHIRLKLLHALLCGSHPVPSAMRCSEPWVPPSLHHLFCCGLGCKSILLADKRHQKDLCGMRRRLRTRGPQRGGGGAAA